MRACIQRVGRAKVSLPERDNRVVGQIDRGLLVLLGVGVGDAEKEAVLLAKKTVELRIFEDDQGKMNWDLSQIGGSVLVVSQFTLYADCLRGKRPGFTEAAEPSRANELYRLFVEEIRKRNVSVATGVFRENMAVELVNDGPVTIWLDTDFWIKK